MDYKLTGFLYMQISTLPLVIVCLVGIALGFVRRDLGTRARWGVSGFSLLLAAEFVAMYMSYLMVYHLEQGMTAQLTKSIAKLSMTKTGLNCSGLVMLVAAAFHRPKTPQLSEAIAG